jgi:hypothetical protein
MTDTPRGPGNFDLAIRELARERFLRATTLTPPARRGCAFCGRDLARASDGWVEWITAADCHVFYCSADHAASHHHLPCASPSHAA